MYRPRYVWMLIGDYVDRWWEAAIDTVHSVEQLRVTTFTIDSLNSLSNDDLSSANIVRKADIDCTVSLYWNYYCSFDRLLLITSHSYFIPQRFAVC
ncbi:hypothetical protein DPMN_115597 [Dreissena polymorpha]|uniref:Uncharacterized protein n=1 Tax=Dreissena polymorpha TaxID=45954 RepID=A0A9D4KM93_DREPO|nr:hypothetical protein DPMN_115597 [Dreissena polymorpha]